MGPLFNEQYGEMLEIPNEGADSVEGHKMGAINLEGTELFQVAQV